MKLDEMLKGQDLKEIEKKTPQLMSQFYAHFYEQGKILTRLKALTSLNRSDEEVKAQQEFQKKWKQEFSPEELKDINATMNKWLKKWYNQAKEEVMPRHGKSLVGQKHEFVPLIINRRKADPNSAADVNYFLDEKNEVYTDIKEGKVGLRGWKEMVSLLKQPFKAVNFEGYGGFISKKDKENSTEGKETFGLTNSTRWGEQGWTEENKNKNPIFTLKYVSKGVRDIVITFCKRLYLNRLGYEEWITDLKASSSRQYFDISFEDVVETIAHELAHAIVATMKFEYEGQEGGGHGKLFYDVMEEIEEMMRNSPDFSEFENWWKIKK
jgi:hypothetical protein